MTKATKPKRTRTTSWTIERTFKAPPERVWAMWTTKDGIESWWGPVGFITEVRALDLRPGGVFDSTMTAVGKEQVAALKQMGMPLSTAARSTYTEVVPPRRIAYRTKVDFVPGVAPYEIETTIEFHGVRGETQMTFTSSRMHDAKFQELSRQGQEEQLGKLAKVLEEIPRSRPSTTFTFPSDHEVLITRVFDAPPERVYRAHADPEALAQWWGPRGYATKVDRWDLRPGGAWRIVQHDLDGRKHGFRGTFQEVAPPERLVWTIEYEGMLGHIHTEAITFEAHGKGQTLLTVRAVYANQADRDGWVGSGMEWGLRQSHERLDELLGGGS